MLGQHGLRRRRPRHDQQARGIFIEAMHDPSARYAREVWVEMSDGISVRVAQSRRKAVVEWEMSLRRGGV